MQHPIWTLYSRRTFSRLAYWLSALGYNLRDRSLNNRIYLVYFCAFWLVWVGAMFALLGQTLAGWLVLLPYPPEQVASDLAQVGLTAWAWITLWQVSGRSPFIFTEEDACLVCQTPASRRRIGMALFLQGWLGSLLPFAAGTIVLAFSLAEVHVLLDDTGFALGWYVSSALRALGVVIPLQAGLQAGIWGLGAWRLHPQRGELRLRLAALILLMSLAGAWGLSSRLPGLWDTIRYPLATMLDAAFNASQVHWLAGLVLSLAILALGLGGLATATPRMSLAQAARETSRWALVQAARGYWNFSLAEALQIRQRLGSGRRPSKLLQSSDATLLLQKDLLQTRRTFRLGSLLSLAGILGLSLGIFLPTSLPLQLVSAGVWTITVSNLMTRRLRNDLARWWILRSLPVQTSAMLRAEMQLPWMVVVGLGWLAVTISGLPISQAILAVLLLPFLGANAALAGAGDILRRAQARVIMSPSLAEENVPQLDIRGAIVGLASVLLPLGLLLWAGSHGLIFSGGVIALLLAAGLARLNFGSAQAAFRRVG